MADVSKIISKIMTSSKSESQLVEAGMWDAEKKKFKPVSSYKLTYDSQQNQIEPIYYWILDFMQDARWETKKITDNFMASPGSGQFQDMNLRARNLQEEGMKILGGLNQVIKSALNLIYDLKEFKLRLAHYEDYHSKEKHEEGSLALKQIWLDNVDLKRGRGSIHQMAAELGYTTIREAFMMANSVDELSKLSDKNGVIEINDSVKRILIPRISEFLKWVEYSEDELKKRYKIEQSYLRSQVETIKLYSAWMKPYLKAAEQLRQNGFEGNAALVNAFSTSMFELTLMGRKETKVPKQFSVYSMKRNYFSVIVVSFNYRGHVSQRVTQKGDYGYGSGGRVDMTFDAYSLNSEELKLIEDELKNADVAESMNFSGDLAAESLDALKKDLEELLQDPDKEKVEKKKKEDAAKKKSENDINPFSALFGVFFKKKEKKNEKKLIEKIEDLKKDNYVEKVVRAVSSVEANAGLYTIYDVYKKVHGMASSPEDFENSGTAESWDKKSKGGKVGLKDSFKSGFDKF